MLGDMPCKGCAAVLGDEARRQRIVSLARDWLGTPYVHQAACKGAGADCLGLIRGIWRELGLGMPEVPPPYAPDWSEASGDERLWRAAERHLLARKAPALGAVLLFRMRPGAVAKHLGLVSEMGGEGGAQVERFIHAYSGHGVVETRFSDFWQRRLVAVFEFP